MGSMIADSNFESVPLKVTGVKNVCGGGFANQCNSTAGHTDRKKLDVKQSDGNARHRAFTVAGIILCVILIPLLIVNLTLIIRSFTNPDKVPGVFGYMPLIILSGSMEPEISAGDLVVCTNVDAADVQVGDVIAFFDPSSSSSSVLTHRVVEVQNDGGAIQFKTQGDANNAADANLVPAANLVGAYSIRISGAGNVAMFFQTVPGVVVCVVVPVVLLIVYDMIRRRRFDKFNAHEVEALRAELADLRAVSA